MSQLTTHVLDTSIGKPAAEVSITLQHYHSNSWAIMASGMTNSDGRIGELLPPGKVLTHGKYRMIFDTGAYFKRQDIKTFYPEVIIEFQIFDESHYHIPLLLSPFGYSTYRGS